MEVYIPCYNDNDFEHSEEISDNVYLTYSDAVNEILKNGYIHIEEKEKDYFYMETYQDSYSKYPNNDLKYRYISNSDDTRCFAYIKTLELITSFKNRG